MWVGRPIAVVFCISQSGQREKKAEIAGVEV